MKLYLNLKGLYLHIDTKLYRNCIEFTFLYYILSVNPININLCFIKKNLTNTKRDLDRSSLTNKRIVNKMIFVIIKKLIIFQKPWERGGIGRRTALKMRHLRVCRFKSDRSHFNEYL